jgi:hypothetical protein
MCQSEEARTSLKSESVSVDKTQLDNMIKGAIDNLMQTDIKDNKAAANLNPKVENIEWLEIEAYLADTFVKRETVKVVHELAADVSTYNDAWSKMKEIVSSNDLLLNDLKKRKDTINGQLLTLGTGPKSSVYELNIKPYIDRCFYLSTYLTQNSSSNADTVDIRFDQKSYEKFVDLCGNVYRPPLDKKTPPDSSTFCANSIEDSYAKFFSECNDQNGALSQGNVKRRSGWLNAAADIK